MLKRLFRFVDAGLPHQAPTGHTDDDINDKNHNCANQKIHSHVPPKHCPSQSP